MIDVCTIERRDEILNKPVLKYSDIMELLGVGNVAAYKWIETIRHYAQSQGKPLPLGKRVTSQSYKDYFDLRV